MIFVTGGAGFIGSNFILNWLAKDNQPVVNLDKLTYASNINNLAIIAKKSAYHFVQTDIANSELIMQLLIQHKPRAIINFAAETHVDRSIINPEQFLQTNVLGTFQLLETVKNYWFDLSRSEKEKFRFLHVSTDEVYGSLKPADPAFTEQTAYAPNSPYAASKAASDHFVRAQYHTYGLPCIITNCSNNYGPYQYPEKFIPLVILNALQDKAIPVYGNGSNIRDWLHVLDHCDALVQVLQRGQIGTTYNIGGDTQVTNLTLVNTICALLDKIKPKKQSYSTLIKFVSDRPGHDFRYAINSEKIKKELNWQPKESFETGIYKTIQWYLENIAWLEAITKTSYAEWINQNYSER